MKSPLEGTKKFADEEQGGSLFVTVTCRAREAAKVMKFAAAPTPTLLLDGKFDSRPHSYLLLTTLLYISINIHLDVDEV